MLRTIATAATLLAVFAAAGAQTAKSSAKPPKTIVCAVMTKDKVDIAKATKAKMYQDYKGRRYFFCCAGCPATFKAHPEKYRKSPSIPTPKTPAKPKVRSS